MLPTSCHSTSAIRGDTIHRRMRPISNRNELDVVRLPHEDYKFEDVDAVIPGDNSRVVMWGRNQGHKDGVGGISVQGYDDSTIHNSANNMYAREEGDSPISGKNPSRNIHRWHCYKCLRVDIPLTYDVLYDDYPHHGFLYPLSEIDILDLHVHETTLFPVGRFPGISSIPSWTFCCNLLQNQEIVVVAGEPNEIDFKDEAVGVLFYALRLSASNTPFYDEADDCIDIKRWIISNCDVRDNVRAISRKAPHDMCDRILYHIENARAYTSFCNKSEAICDLMRFFASRSGSEI